MGLHTFFVVEARVEDGFDCARRHEYGLGGEGGWHVELHGCVSVEGSRCGELERPGIWFGMTRVALARWELRYV